MLHRPKDGESLFFCLLLFPLDGARGAELTRGAVCATVTEAVEGVECLRVWSYDCTTSDHDKKVPLFISRTISPDVLHSLVLYAICSVVMRDRR